jgi:hypothetical protein
MLVIVPARHIPLMCSSECGSPVLGSRIRWSTWMLGKSQVLIRSDKSQARLGVNGALAAIVII